MNTVQVYPGKAMVYPRKRNMWYLRLVSSNGETLAHSQGYFSKWNAKRAARKNFPGLPIKVFDVTPEELQ